MAPSESPANVWRADTYKIAHGYQDGADGGRRNDETGPVAAVDRALRRKGWCPHAWDGGWGAPPSFL